MRKPSRKTAHVLLNDASMRSLPLRLVRLVTPLLSAAIAFVALQGCGASPDTAGDQGSGTTYGATVDTGEEGVGDVGDDTPEGPMIAADDGAPVGTTHQGLTANGQMKTTANLNLRKGAGTGFGVIAVVPSGTTVKLLSATAQSGFLNIEFNGTAGWGFATYLTEVAGSTGGASSSSGGSSSGGAGGGGAIDLEGAMSPDNAIARAKAAVGFSYYWGGGAWLPGGPTSSTKGSCSGSCPSCSHSGKYGADCSGLVAKAWQFGTKALESNSHPYSTASFVSDSSGHW